MAFNVEAFKSTMQGYGGLAQANKFLVQCDAPPKIRSFAGATAVSAQDLSFFCDTTSLPGKNINTFDYKRQAYGDVTKLPMSRASENVQCTFFVDSNYKILKFFQTWLDYVIEGTDESPNTILDGGRQHREIGFKEDYETRMVIRGFSDLGSTGQGIEYTLHGAYPIQVGAVSMGWEQNDTLIKLPVEFTYTYYTTRKLDGINPGLHKPSGIGFFTRLAQLGSIAGVISTIKKPTGIQDAINQVTGVSTILKSF